MGIHLFNTDQWTYPIEYHICMTHGVWLNRHPNLRDSRKKNWRKTIDFMQGRWKYMIAVARGEVIDWLFAASSSMSGNIHAKIIIIAESQLPYIFILHLYELDNLITNVHISLLSRNQTHIRNILLDPICINAYDHLAYIWALVHHFA